MSASRPELAPWYALLNLEGEALLRAAYPYLLGREIDPEGLAHHLQRLRAGEDKLELLAGLRDSAEGRAHGAPVAGLRGARLRRRCRQLPVLGSLLRRCPNAQRQQRDAARHLALHERLEAHIQRHEQHYRVLSAEQQVLGARQATPDPALAELRERLRLAENLNQELRARLTALESAPRAAASQPLQVPASQTPATDAAAAPASNLPSGTVPDSFYLAFEDRFRGSAETINARLSYYLPTIAANPALARGLPLVDIGCGRGEWLALLPPEVERLGIDLNATNVELCRARGLPAEHTDAIAWLAAQPAGSIGAVSAFHVIEHLGFERLNQLLDVCLHALAPGGLILFETPNPENIVTSANYFWTDPTHIHPLPPAFTEFLVQFKGYAQVEIHKVNAVEPEHRLHEDSEVARHCNRWFYGPQDYAVIAQRP
ncbi:class I SAM-dependent methyltransferase [uncultured Pseudomonas sp.]|uniref:class I SAM-dependent methyltransferase n=1 Tax=uncultured Pseudomonas sp. TaxID=114707 RepID=UPI00258CCB4C|nr:class I SAM-dependent methyltransferase [uncultured Pseudomonas sp.]